MVTAQVIIPLEYAHELISGMLRRSMWFTISPLPDGLFEVTVKAEHSVWLSNWLVNQEHAMEAWQAYRRKHK